MQTLIHNVKWQVSLSNGETFYEEKGNFKSIPNIDSPWQRLNEYACDVKADITSLSLYTNDGRSFNLPSAGKNPKFRAFDMQEKPLYYEMYRKLGQDFIKGGNAMNPVSESALFTVIVAYYDGYQLQLWVDENNTKNCWTLMEKI